jgi:hypothetical protein
VVYVTHSSHPAAILLTQDEVTEALKQSDASINNLKREMLAFRDAAERVRGDIRALHNRSGVVRLNQKCELCGVPVLAQLFYLFACSHAFHRSCLRAEASMHLNALQNKRLERQLSTLTKINDALSVLEAPEGSKGIAAATATTRSGTTKSANSVMDRSLVIELLGIVDGGALPATHVDLVKALQAKREDVQAEVDSLVASECLYCGEAMIASIAEPFGVTAGPPTGRAALEGSAVTLDDDWEI